MQSRRVRAAAFAAVAAAGLAMLGGPAVGWDGIVEGAAGQVVVGDPAALSNSDEAVIAELEDMGFAVTTIDDQATPTAGSSTAVVVSAPSAQSVGGAYKTVDAPVLLLGNPSWPATGLSTGPDGIRHDTQSLVVVDTDHPVAVGLPATFAPAGTTGALQSLAESYLPSGADPVAVRSGSENAHVVYTVPDGGTLGDESTAPQRRVVLGYTAHTLTDMSGYGYMLFDNAVHWAAEGSPGATAPRDGSGGQAARATTGRWLFDMINQAGPTQDTTPSAQGDPDEKGILDEETLVVVDEDEVAASGAASLDFPGWDDGSPGNGMVHMTKSSVRIDHSQNFNPQSRREFTVTVYIRPENTVGDADGNPIEDDDSPNIIQKGLSNNTDGQWKISMKGTMEPLCTFRGDTDDTSEEFIENRSTGPDDGPETLVAGNRYRIECSLIDRLVELDVDVYDETTDGFVDHATGAAGSTFGDYVRVVNTNQVWVGKKQGSEDDADTYSGAIDNISIKRSGQEQ